MKREKLKKNLCMLLILITGMNLKVVAQEVSVGADLVSSYIWRGQIKQRITGNRYLYRIILYNVYLSIIFNFFQVICFKKQTDIFYFVAL